MLRLLLPRLLRTLNLQLKPQDLPGTWFCQIRTRTTEMKINQIQGYPIGNFPFRKSIRTAARIIL
jgi:hypothetical protein